MEASKSSRWNLLSVIVAGASSAALYTLCFPPYYREWLAWFALAPLLVVIPRLSSRAVEWLGFLTGFALYAVGFRWFHALFGFPAVALWGLLALFFAVFCVLVSSLPRTMAWGWKLLLIPCFWVAVEFVRCEQWPLRFSWLALGYSQYHNRALLPLAGVVGVYGISFVLVACAVYVAAAWRERWWIAAGFCFLWAAIMYPLTEWSSSRSGHPTKDTGRIVLVQSNSSLRTTLFRYSDRGLAGPEIPTMVVWPEYAVQFTEKESPEAYAAVRRYAKDRRVTLVYGGLTSRGGEQYSSAGFVVGPDGRDLGHYEKHNPLPFFKDGQPGSDYPVFRWRIGKRCIPFGVTICFDLSFERNARMLSRNGARMLVVPSMEPDEWPRIEQEQHAVIACLRAAENNVGIIRCSTPGPSQIVSARGYVRAGLPAGEEGVLVERPVVGEGRTIYNRFGWLFPYLCQGVTLGWMVSRFRLRLRRASPAIGPSSLPS